MLNQIETPQRFYLAKERDKLWLQKAATRIESAKILSLVDFREKKIDGSSFKINFA